MEILLKAGVNINMKDDWGSTALYAAAFHGKEEVVRILLKNGADVDVKVVDGKTPLYIAASNGNYYKKNVVFKVFNLEEFQFQVMNK